MDLNSALKRIPTIHQQHAIKCYLAIKNLKRFFYLSGDDWSEDDWLKVEQLVDKEEPIFNTPILQNTELPFDVTDKRRHWVLSHAVYPYAYFVMQAWFKTEQPKAIFNYYLAQCLECQEYLNHHISILFSFERVWYLLHTPEQKLRFIERFCEFVTATFYGNNHLIYQPKADYKRPLQTDKQLVLKQCLTHPGFWGHNIISFASIVRKQQELSNDKFDTLMLNLHEQCFWEFDDEMDKPVILSRCKEAPTIQLLASKCRALLLTNTDNLHQITLSESVVYLFHLPWIKDTDKLALINILEHFSKSE